MSYALTKDKRIKMKKSVVQHRKKVLDLLENVFKVDFKPKVISSPNGLLGLDMFVKTENRETDTGYDKVKEEYNVKQELLESDSINNSCESDVSVGSVEPWICQKPVQYSTDEEFKRRSSRLLSNEISKDHTKLYYKKSKEDYVYDSPMAEKIKKKSKKRLIKNPSGSIKEKRFKEPTLRKEHNAKERLCRSLIAKSFIELSKCCSFLDTKRRVPSKFSILNAAKKECDSLKMYEKKLLVEKEYWKAANAQLKRRLKNGAINKDLITIDD